ncbi:MAG: hypothetical protein JWN57_2416 [Frankiales bacterium]|jgi:Tfp pilus assembly protein PilV|nr:hypothetical protein [Frankiales bacterium]
MDASDSARRGRALAPRGRDDGFGVAEVVVAIAILMMMATAVLAGLGAATKSSARSRDQVTAASLAAQLIEQARAQDVSSVVSTSWAAVPGAPNFSARTTASWVLATGDETCRGPQLSRNSHKQVRVEVQWGATAGTGSAAQPVTADTLLLAPTADSPGRGAQRVRLRNPANQPPAPTVVQLVPEAPLTGPTQTGTTNSFGCVVFRDLVPGPYLVQVVVAGTVGLQGESPVEQRVNVAAEVASPVVELAVGPRTSITAVPTIDASTLPGSSTYCLPTYLADSATWGGTQVPGSNASACSSANASFSYGATVANNGLQPTGYVSRPSYSFPSLFPFPDGYRAWAGTCAGNNPATVGKVAPVVTAPATTVNVRMQPVHVTVIKDGGSGGDSALSGTWIWAYHASTYGCPPGSKIAIWTGSAYNWVTAGAAYRFGPTNGNGVVRVQLPYGSWTFAGYQRPWDATWPTVTLNGQAVPSVTVRVR